MSAVETIQLELHAFGIAREVVGGARIFLEVDHPATVLALRAALLRAFPELGHLRSLAIAVNETYAEDALVLSATDEIVLIPPVSGG